MNQRVHGFFWTHMGKIKSKFDSTLNENILTTIYMTLSY